eukprot:6989599-Pyramimonas_sp.AAC.1
MRAVIEELSKIVPIAKPSGEAASGEVTAERAVQPPREPVVAPVTCVEAAKTPGEEAEEAIRQKCTANGTGRLSGKRFPKRSILTAITIGR